MAAIAYYILQRAIIAQQGRDSCWRRPSAAIGRVNFRPRSTSSPFPRVREFLDCSGLYVFVALMWLVPDRRIERLLVKRDKE